MSALSDAYGDSARLLRGRLRELRAQLRAEQDRERRLRLRYRISVLAEMLRQTNELTELTARYYERGYWRNAKYTL